MTNFRPIALGASVGLSIVLIGWWAMGAGKERDSEAAAGSESTRSPVVAPAPAAPAAVRPLATQGVAAPVPLDPAAFHAQGTRDRDAAARKLESAWSADAAAPQVAAQTEQKLLEAMETGLSSQARFQPTTSAPSCRASLCRIEAEFAAGQDGNDWATRLLLDMGGTFGNTTTLQYEQPEGRSQLVVYAFRLGKQLPQ
jgi:hypothetical protein